MKQGNNSLLEVGINYDFDEIEKIEFVFVQGATRKAFVYPSEKVVKATDKNSVLISWGKDDTYLFRTDKPIQMDTRIKLVGADTNPETEIASFMMTPTLFRRNDE